MTRGGGIHIRRVIGDKSAGGRGLTLGLAAVLHAFTHAYQSVLVPLYILMVADLKLPGVRSAALVVAVYGAVYFLLSYPAGVLADRLNRKVLLGVGLVGNALAIGLMGLTHQYWAILALAVAAGMFGTLFHPAANALMSAHYPKSPGMALGMLGIGSGIGFFFGSQYAGWRAETVTHTWLGTANWQAPCVEMGLAGIGVGLIFLVLARGAARAGAAGEGADGGAAEVADGRHFRGYRLAGFRRGGDLVAPEHLSSEGARPGCEADGVDSGGDDADQRGGHAAGRVGDVGPAAAAGAGGGDGVRRAGADVDSARADGVAADGAGDFPGVSFGQLRDRGSVAGRARGWGGARPRDRAVSDDLRDDGGDFAVGDRLVDRPDGPPPSSRLGISGCLRLWAG